MVLLTVTPTLIVLQLLPEFFFNSPLMSPVSFPPAPPHLLSLLQYFGLM